MADPQFELHLQLAGARLGDLRGVSVAVDYADAEGEYDAARSGAGLYAALDRGLIEVRGADRAAWLHNLTTNAVKTLRPGDGNYAYAVNVKGRILMDFNIQVAGDAIWLDIDRRLAAKAMAHFDRYTITEDVQCRDRSAEFVRLGLTGPGSIEIADALGVSHAKAMPSLASTPVPLMGRHRLLVRHDFAGVFGVEFHIEAADAAGCWDRLLEIGRPAGLRPVGWNAVNTLRIESGIPWYGHDIDEEVLPAETGQVERAISYVKGCYLGQEVVERMRSRGSVARKLIGVKFDDPGGPPAGSPLHVAGAEAGRLTSTCRSPALDAWIGLGYLKAAQAGPGTRVNTGGDEGPAGTVAALPFVPPAASIG